MAMWLCKHGHVVMQTWPCGYVNILWLCKHPVVM